MKRRNILGLIICILSFSSCYEEDKIVPKIVGEEFIRFEFPQGDDAWDEDIVSIQEQFGVYLIYKNFKHEDFNRSWTGALPGIEMYGENLTDEQAELNTKFMKNHIFAHLNSKVVSKVLPKYFYMVYDYHNKSMLAGFELKVAHKFNKSGLDFWGLCLFYGEPSPLTGETIKTPETAEEFRVRRCAILGHILKNAFNRGNIILPIGLEEGMDYKTPVLYGTGDENDENFYVKRGFPGIMVDPNFENPPRAAETPTPINDHFIELMNISIRYTKEEYEAMWNPTQYPLIHQKRQLVIDHFRNNYQIDLEKIAELREGW